MVTLLDVSTAVSPRQVIYMLLLFPAESASADTNDSHERRCELESSRHCYG